MKLKNVIVVVFLVIFGQNVNAQKWVPTSGTVKFKISMLGLGVNGTLSGIKANVDFNPENTANSSIFATVDSKTVFTDNKLRDTHLKEKPEFFESDKYPVITLKSNSITKSSDGYVGTFDLTIKKVTKSVKIPFKFTQADNKGTFSAKFDINRKDWNFGGNTVGMGDKVTISLSLNANR